MFPFLCGLFLVPNQETVLYELRARTITGFLIPGNEPLTGLYTSDLVLRGTRGGWPVYSASDKTQVRSYCRLVYLLELEKALTCGGCIAWSIIS